MGYGVRLVADLVRMVAGRCWLGGGEDCVGHAGHGEPAGSWLSGVGTGRASCAPGSVGRPLARASVARRLALPDRPARRG